MNRKTSMVLHILCPIAAGTLLYSIMAPDVIWMKKAAELFGGSARMPAPLPDNVLLQLVRSYLPDMMWGYSLVFALFCIIGDHAADLWKVFGTAFPFSVIMEMLQKISFVPGTFDVFDIFAEFLAETIAVCIIYQFYSKEDI